MKVVQEPNGAFRVVDDDYYKRMDEMAEQAAAKEAAKAAGPNRRPLSGLGFMVQPALLIALFAIVWIASGFLYAVAALGAIALLYRPLAVPFLGAIGWWYDRKVSAHD